MLSRKTEGFNGAEIEECIKEAMFVAYVDNPEAPVLKASHLVDAISKTVPLSTTMKEQISALRQWASTRAKKCFSRNTYNAAQRNANIVDSTRA